MPLLIVTIIGYGYIMEHGSIVRQGTASQLANDTDINKAYFEIEL
jgi:ABC-type branched-subunit amino acid transport system ATPase component